MELIKKGDLPLTPLGLEKMRPDLGYTGASARMLYQPDSSKASDPIRLLTQLLDLVRTATQIATFKAGDKRKTIHQHLFLPKDYSGSPITSIYTPWTSGKKATGFSAGLINQSLVLLGPLFNRAHKWRLKNVPAARYLDIQYLKGPPKLNRYL